jgi:hypothetical protein
MFLFAKKIVGRILSNLVGVSVFTNGCSGKDGKKKEMGRYMAHNR